MEKTFAEPGMMTGLGRHADAVSELPGDFAGVARVLHGLFIHEAWAGIYDVKLTGEDLETVHLRKTSDLLDAVTAKSTADLRTPRPPAARVPTNCRGFATIATALLRAHGVPARARCGFGMYFTEGWAEDHWVTEYYDDGRWKRGDAQLDPAQVKALGIDWDVNDLPTGRFLTGGEAWQRIRAGLDRDIRFGLSSIPEDGEFWIAQNMMRDVASLGGQEALPWDVWPPMTEPGEPIDYAWFDRMAAGEETTEVPAEVFSAHPARRRMVPFS